MVRNPRLDFITLLVMTVIVDGSGCETLKQGQTSRTRHTCSILPTSKMEQVHNQQGCGNILGNHLVQSRMWGQSLLCQICMYCEDASGKYIAETWTENYVDKSTINVPPLINGELWPHPRREANPIRHQDASTTTTSAFLDMWRNSKVHWHSTAEKQMHNDVIAIGAFRNKCER